MQFNVNIYEKLNILLQASSEYLEEVLFNTIFEKKEDIAFIWNSYARRRCLVLFTVTGLLSHRRLLVGYRMRMYFNKKKNVFIAVKISLRRCDCFDLNVYDSCGEIVTNMSTKCFFEYVSFKAQFWSQSYYSTKYVFHFFFKEIKKISSS